MIENSSFPYPLGRSVTVEDLVGQVGGARPDIVGDAALAVTCVTALDDGVEGALAFCKTASPTLARGQVAASGATVIVTAVEVEATDGKCFLVTSDPMRWFIMALRSLLPAKKGAGIHPTAIVSPDARLGEDVDIGPYAIVDDGVVVGAGSELGPGCHVHEGTVVGRNCAIGEHSSVGNVGLGVSRADDDVPLRFPHLGRVIIGDDVAVGAHTSIMRGILKDTIIEDWCQIGHSVNVGHNCHIERNCWVSAQAILCGSAHLEPNVMVAAGAIVNNHVRVGEGATVGLGSVATKNVRRGERVFGIPARQLMTMRPIS